MTPAAGSLGRPDRVQRAAICQLVAAWAREAHGGWDRAPRADDVEVVDVALVRDGRPGILDVVAVVAGRLAHAVLGLRLPGDELHALGSVEVPVLGSIEDDHGPAVVVDALHEAEVARLLLAEVGGRASELEVGTVTLEREAGRAVAPPPAVSIVDDEPDAVLTFDERCSLRVFPWLHPWPHPGVAVLLALDESGFNHLAPPLAVWRRDGRDLGVLQEIFVGAAPGWAVALGSLRDLCASGTAPERAGGDFAPEAHAIGTMVARMHLALERAFGWRPSEVAAWVEEAESVVARVDAAALDGPDVRQALAGLHGVEAGAHAVRVHGDLHLGRTARCDQGWVLADCMPGGTDQRTGELHYRSPLADVADVLWSLHHAAAVAAAELARDPLGHPRAAELAAAWEARNRRAFLSGYLATAGIGELLPAGRDVVRDLLVLFELERDARLALRRHPSGQRPGGT